MYEFARAIHDERLREAEHRRIASSLPKCRSWELGSYRITIQRRSRDLAVDGGR
ncbi:MAG: hypothetical protein KY394_03445 [Actinobacteria bacterium]|nr:hypothetical protein [Actinomycetota bacterium]